MSMRYGRVRDAVLTGVASLFASSTRPLWYAETIVLAARYQQWLRSSPWARDAVRYRDRLQLWERGAIPVLRSRKATVLEFGVADGLATQWWAASGVEFEAWHGFDTFEGLPAAWGRAGVPVMAAGVFTPDAGRGAVPEVVAPYAHTWHRGLIEDTLPDITRPEGPLFVLIDVDLIAPTEVILAWLQKHGQPGDVVYFDEAFDPWNEGMALRRAIDNGLSVHAIGYTGSGLLVEVGEPAA